MDDLETQVRDRLLAIISLINKPGVVTSEQGDDWIEVYHHVSLALDVVLKLEEAHE